MSLQIWLPLRNNLMNYGVSGLQTASVQSGVATSADGKLGQCYKNSGTTANVTTTINLTVTAFTMCSWVRVDTQQKNWCRAWGLIGSDSAYMGLCCEHTNGTLGFHYYKTYNGTNTGIFDTYPCSAVVGTWVHYAMAYDGAKYYIYVNGSLIASAATTKTNVETTITGLKLFGGNGSYSSKHSLTDVRLYDHCLSPKEVKEISKALVIHFPLDDQYGIGKINKYNAPYSAGECGPGSFTRTKLTNERGYNYKLTRTGTGSSSWPSMGLGAYTFTVGKRYYYSCKVRCNKWTSGGFYFRAARSSNDWVTSSVQVCSPSLADGKWHEYYTSVVVNETYDRSGTTVTCSPRIEFYTSDQKAEGTVFDMDFDLKDLQVVESDVYMPFIENDFASNIMSDTSGFQYNATSSGAIKTTADTPKYSCATYFPSGSGIFAHPAITLSAFTISFWAKHTATGKMVFGSSSEASSTDRNWYWYGDNSFKYPDGEFYYAHNAGSAESLLNKWTHFVAVYNGSTITVYRNSVNEGNQAASGTKTLNYLSVGIGYGSSGYWENSTMSDFRLYATALSADDIKQLYQTSASIDNNGNVFCSDIQEV